MKYLTITIIILLTSLQVSAKDWSSSDGVHKIRKYEDARYYLVNGKKKKKVTKHGYISLDLMPQPNNVLAFDKEFMHLLVDDKGKKVTITPIGYSKSITPKNYNLVNGLRKDKKIRLLYEHTKTPGINALNIAFINEYGKPINYIDNVVSGYKKKIGDHFFFETITKDQDKFLVVTDSKGVLQSPPVENFYRFSVMTNSIANDNFDIFYEVYALPHPENNELMIPIMANGSPAPMLKNNIIGYLPFYNETSAVRKKAESALIHSWIGVHAMDDGSFKYSYASPGFEYQTDAVFINTDWQFKQEWTVKSYFLYGEISPGNYGLYWFDTVDKSHWYHYKRVDNKNYNKHSVENKIKNIKYELEEPKRRYQAELKKIAQRKADQKKRDEEYRAQKYKEFQIAMNKGQTSTAKRLAIYIKGNALAEYCSSYQCTQHQIKDAIATAKNNSYYKKLHSQLQYRKNTGTANWHQQLKDWSNNLDEERRSQAAKAPVNFSQIVQEGMKSWKANQQQSIKSIKSKSSAKYTKDLKNWTYGKQNWKPEKPNN